MYGQTRYGFLFLLALAVSVTGAAAGGDGLASRLAGASGGDGWVSYTVPLLDGPHRMCCSRDRDGENSSGTCNLDRGSFSVTLDDERLPPGDRMQVLIRFRGGEPDRVRAYDSGCRVEARGGIRSLGAVDPEESLAWLSGLIGPDGVQGEDEPAEGALMAIAFHAHPGAFRTLKGFTSTDRPQELRSRAAFWLGTTRGEEAFDLLRAMVRDDPSAEVREQAIFAIYVSDAPQAEDYLLELARGSGDSEVRARSMFWLGQKAGDRVADLLHDAAVDDPDLEVKEQAVFALSQLPNGEGVTRLIDLARTHDNPEIRRAALFWLGQSQDPRALDLFEELLR